MPPENLPTEPAELGAPPSLDAARVLVVDDETPILDVVRRALTLKGARVTCAPDARAAIGCFEAARYDCVVSDILMPGPSGLDLLSQVRQRDPDVGFVLMTAAGEVADARRAMRFGCDDFLMKPLALDELYLSVQLAVEKFRQRTSVHRDRDHFERLAAERTLRLQATLERLDQALESEKAAHRQTILVLAQAAENSDRDMGKHIHRVASYATLLAQAMGVEERAAQDMGLSATLHDVGKIAVAPELLNRRGPLTPAEFVEVQKHTIAGGRILQGIDFLAEARQIALAHHERWDGAGYPYGLRGEHIPLPARITALADVWDALTSQRCYKQAWPVERALDHIRRERGGHFDPELVDACLDLQERFEDVRLSLADRAEPLSRRDVLRPFRPTEELRPESARSAPRSAGPDGQLPLN